MVVPLCWKEMEFSARRISHLYFVRQSKPIMNGRHKFGITRHPKAKEVPSISTGISS